MIIKKGYAVPEEMKELVAQQERDIKEYTKNLNDSIAKREKALIQLSKATGVDIETLRLI